MSKTKYKEENNTLGNSALEQYRDWGSFMGKGSGHEEEVSPFVLRYGTRQFLIPMIIFLSDFQGRKFLKLGRMWNHRK